MAEAEAAAQRKAEAVAAALKMAEAEAAAPKAAEAETAREAAEAARKVPIQPATAAENPAVPAAAPSPQLGDCPLHKCAACEIPLPQTDYSSTQLKKKGKAKCKRCVGDVNPLLVVFELLPGSVQIDAPAKQLGEPGGSADVFAGTLKAPCPISG